MPHTHPLRGRLARLSLSAALGLAAAALWLFVLAPGPALGAPPAAPASGGHVFTANSGADFPDASPGDGVCATVISGSVCTLRAAIMEANADPGPDTIVLAPNTTYQLTRPAQGSSALFGTMDLNDSLGGDLDITDSVTLLGAGPASTLIDGNGAVIGDRVFQITGTVVISGVTIEHGQGQNEAGGLENYFRLTLINSVVYSNTAVHINDYGGGVLNNGWLTVTHSSILSNATGTSNATGGGMYNLGTLFVRDSTFQGNSTYAGSGASGEGGGLSTTGYTSTIVNTTFSGNTGALGGGLYVAGYPLAIINSTIANNNSTSAGGGIYVANGKASLYNTTVTGNVANSDKIGSGQGGGVANAPVGTFNFINSIIALNSYVVLPGPLLEYDDCAGAITSQSNNLMVAVNAPHCTLTGTATLADPLLGPLQDNGGPTLTEALLPGSPAIDHGSASGCTDNVGALITTDQRGLARPGRCDIGAFEFYYLLGLPLVQR